MLLKKPLELGAIKYFIQAGHHQTAIEAAVGYVDAGCARFLQEHRNENDNLAFEFSSIECKWVIETIYQGAYLRTYHLWEKDCREYFLSQAAEVPKYPKPNFTEYVKRLLSSRFCLDVPNDVMGPLSTMRSKVNRMKHKGGVQDDEFVSAAEYAAAVAAIESFWEFLNENERVGNSTT
jgi:hypothetical protein